MAAMELLCHSMGIKVTGFSKEELLLLEAEVFVRICEELKELYREQYQDYFRLMKFTINMENTMLESNFLRLILEDILSTKEYNLCGIACYLDTHEDVLEEVIKGRNTFPSAILLRRSIDLHRSVRRELYQSIGKKIVAEYLAMS